MKLRRLGLSDLHIAPLVLGGNVFGWTLDKEASFRILDAFIDHGFNMVDTANMYSAWIPGNKGGESETIIGQWLKKAGAQKRHRVLLATKVGMPMGDGSQGLKKDYILRAVEDSLRRLNTEVIDLYQSHQDDADTPFEETFEAYAQLIKEGKVRAIGASNFTAERLSMALETARLRNFPRYISLQPEYNLYDRAHFETTLEPLCEEEELGVICYYGLASGFLTGKYRTDADIKKSQRGSSIKSRYMNPRGMHILKALDILSKAHSTTPAALALAWLMHRPSVTAPIASATSVAQLADLVQAAHLSLSAAEIKQLDEASAFDL